MSLKAKLLGLFDVLLRVPPLFIIDGEFQKGLGFPQTTTILIEKPRNESIASTDVLSLDLLSALFQLYDAENCKIICLMVLKCIYSFATCIGALGAFMLRTKHLIIIYMFILSLTLVFTSYSINTDTMTAVIEANSPMSLLEDILSADINLVLANPTVNSLVFNGLIQALLGGVFGWVHLGPRYPLLQKAWPLSFLAPTLLACLPLPDIVLRHSPVFACLLPLAMIKFALWSSFIPILQTIDDSILHAKTFASNFGVVPLVETEWVRLNVPTVLRVFWLIRLGEHALALYHPIDVLQAAKSLLISGCENLTAVLGMTSVISCVCHYIGSFFQWVLMVEDVDDKSIGTVSAILFYILALQTGLTGLEPEKRFVRLCRNFCLLYTAILHFIHNIVNPLLMSLSASHNPSLHRHLRALLVCLFLIVYPCCLLAYLWSHHSMSTWLLAVSAFSVEVIVKVIVTLMIYTLFLIDAYRTTFWEKLDDYVYYIRSFGSAVEFCFGIFLFFNGAWILLFESGGAIRAGMMGVHAYFNIWCEARSGWSVFMKRRTAVNKIESLPEASAEQLANLDDVCAICYQEMKSAKITACKHYFHGVCLRKWLYIQDRCPMCHDILYKLGGTDDNEEDQHNQAGDDNQQQVLNHPQLPAAIQQPLLQQLHNQQLHQRASPR